MRIGVVGFVAHVEYQAVFAYAQMHDERTEGPIRRFEMILFQKIEDRRRAVVADMRRALAQRDLVQQHVDDAPALAQKNVDHRIAVRSVEQAHLGPHAEDIRCATVRI